MDRSNQSPKARQREGPTCRTIPASAGPVPQSPPPRSNTPHESHPPFPHQPVPKQTHPIPHSAKTLCLTPHQHPDTQAAAGQGRNEHWIEATNSPSAAARSPTSRTIPASAGPVPRSHLQDEAHHLKSHSQPVPQRACPQPNPPDSAKALYPSPPRDKPGCSGIGPERALDRSTPFPQRGSAKPHLPYDPCECRPCPAEPTPKKQHTPRVPSPISLQPVPKQTKTQTPKPQRDSAETSIGSKQPIPKSAAARSPTSRTIPASAGPVPQSPPKKPTTVLRLPKPAPDCLIGPLSPKCA